MTQLTQNESYLLIEDQLDAVGQKHRLVRILRGAMLWTGWGVVAATLAALAADALGQGPVTLVILVLLCGWLLGSGIHWMGRPLVSRTSPVAIARLIEGRIGGLHDGLTNSVLLAQSADAARNPWLGVIYDEVLATCRKRPLDEAVRFSDLGPLGFRLGGVAAATMLAALLAGGRVAHGWQQILSPGSFVPAAGRAQIIDVQPGDVTLVGGQALEISVAARTAQSPPPEARLVFDGNSPAARLAATVGGADGDLRYSYRIEHVDVPLHYRVDVGGTQSNWFTVRIVPKVSLSGLDIKITPPGYTQLPERTVAWSASDLSALAVPQGSRVVIGATIDVPMKRGVLMVNDEAPLDMLPALGNRRFYGEAKLSADATVFVGILSGEQIIAKLPENGLTIHSIPDGAPTITMRSPAQNETMPPTQDLTITAEIHDDYGVAGARLLAGFGTDEPQVVAESERRFDAVRGMQVVSFPLKLTPEQCRHDSVVTVQVEATDNRDLTALSKALGPQSARSQRIVIHFQDAGQIKLEESQQQDQLAARLKEMIQLQQSLHDRALPVLSAATFDMEAMGRIGKGQDDLRQEMRQTGQPDGTEMDERVRIVKKTLLVLAVNAGSEAVDLAGQIGAEVLAKERSRQGAMLTVKQETIVSTLQALLAGLSAADAPATQPAGATFPPMPSRPAAFKKLDEALKAYEKEEQRIIEQTASLAKKPVDDFDAQQKKNLDDLKTAQEKLDAFMQQNLADFSKNAQQDMTDPALIKDMMEIYSETTMAKDALNMKSVETAVPLEEMGLASAKALETNIDKWLNNSPDRESFSIEDPVNQNDAPEADLPKELQDMIGDLLEQEEDLDQQMQQANSNWHDSMDQGVGWNAKDGPISDNSAKGISSNVLPQNDDVQGRSGDGRSAQSSGQFVGDRATDKGGRNTPTRLDPTPFENGQVKDTGKSPPGGGTGGGKISGMGESGLEGPVPPQLQQEMKRLSHMQAELRNKAEKLNLQYRLGRYDNFKLLEGIVDMRRTESDLNANRYANALRDTDVMVDDLTTSSILLGGRIQVQQDTTPTSSRKERKEIDDAAQGDLPAVWSEALREYYEKLSEQ